MTVELTPSQWNAIIQLINSVSGAENQRVLIPIYDTIIAAAKKLEEEGSTQVAE